MCLYDHFINYVIEASLTCLLIYIAHYLSYRICSAESLAEESTSQLSGEEPPAEQTNPPAATQLSPYDWTYQSLKREGVSHFMADVISKVAAESDASAEQPAKEPTSQLSDEESPAEQPVRSKPPKSINVDEYDSLVRQGINPTFINALLETYLVRGVQPVDSPAESLHVETSAETTSDTFTPIPKSTNSIQLSAPSEVKTSPRLRKDRGFKADQRL